MEQILVKWNTGDGNIVISNDGGDVTISSDTANFSTERRQRLTFRTTTGDAVAYLDVVQKADTDKVILIDAVGKILQDTSSKILIAKSDTSQDYCVFRTESENQSIKIINMKQYAESIRLEDGTDILTSGTGRLDYVFPTAGDHKVWIKLKPELTSVNSIFRDCPELLSVNSDIFYMLSVCTNFGNAFYNCSGLTWIPSDIFAKNGEAIDFSQTFYGCTGLTTISGNLFANNHKASVFYNTFFRCTGLSSLPEKLFYYTLATDVSSCFNACGGLLLIPDKLFINNPITNVANCFRNCSGLLMMPSGIFAHNKDITNFFGCFYYATKAKGETPKDADGGELWERAGKPGYPEVITGTDCFKNCTQLDNFTDVPFEWGGRASTLEEPPILDEDIMI